MRNILTFVDWWVKWKIGSWSLQIWLKNTLDRDLPMMKLLFLFNEFFLYLNAFHQNLNFLEQTYTFLHLLTQLSSLSYVCVIRHGIFNFAAAFLFCRGFFVFPWLFYFVVAVFYFYFFCRSYFIFAVTLFCHDFFILPWLFCFTMTFLFCRGSFIFVLTFLFCRDFFLPWLFSFGVVFLFCRGYFILPWIFHFSFCVAVVFALSWLFILPWLFGFAVTPMGHHSFSIVF